MGQLRDGKNFFKFLSPEASGFVVLREIKNFCPSGRTSFPALRTKILNLPQDNKARCLRR